LCFIILGFPLWGGALLGFLIAWLVKRNFLKQSKFTTGAMVALLLLPFGLAPVERAHFVREEVRKVESSTLVDASPEVVWDRLAAFDEIKPEEFEPGLWHRLGVPRPIKATIDRVGLGGHRVGVFQHGLAFEELVTVFEAPRRMTFDIQVDASK